MSINGQTQPQKFSLYRYRRGSQIPSTANGSKDKIKEGQKAHTMQRLLLTLGLVAISLRSSLYAEDPIRYDPVSQQVIERRLQKYVGNDKQREDTLRQMFSQAGCDDHHLSLQPVKGSKLSNLICACPSPCAHSKNKTCGSLSLFRHESRRLPFQHGMTAMPESLRTNTMPVYLEGRRYELDATRCDRGWRRCRLVAH
jgi:hypothetical protein